MTKLTVEFPTTWPGWDTPSYTLTSVFDEAHDLFTAVVDPDTSCDYYSDSPVFRASFHDKTKSRSITVALKFSMRSDLVPYLVREGELYESILKPLQGSSVPYCRGLYVGTRDDGEEIACLVLDYWGECLRLPFSKTSSDVRKKIFKCLWALHQIGFLHGDFAERNVLVQNGDVRVIDFDDVIPHQCDYDSDPEEPSYHGHSKCLKKVERGRGNDTLIQAGHWILYLYHHSSIRICYITVYLVATQSCCTIDITIHAMQAACFHVISRTTGPVEAARRHRLESEETRYYARDREVQDAPPDDSRGCLPFFLPATWPFDGMNQVNNEGRSGTKRARESPTEDEASDSPSAPGSSTREGVSRIKRARHCPPEDGIKLIIEFPSGERITHLVKATAELTAEDEESGSEKAHDFQELKDGDSGSERAHKSLTEDGTTSPAEESLDAGPSALSPREPKGNDLEFVAFLRERQFDGCEMELPLVCRMVGQLRGTEL